MNVLSQVRMVEGRFLEVGAHVIDTDTLRFIGQPGLRLTPKAAAVLTALVHAAGRTLRRDELLDLVWKGTCPTPDVLTQAITDLRRALGDDLHAPRYIETVPRLGYRLVAPARFAVEVAEPAPADSASTAAAPIAVPAAVTASPRARPLIKAALFATVAAVIVAVGGLVLRHAASDSRAATARWHVTMQRTITSAPGAENFPHVSPDGTRVAYTVGDHAAKNARIVQKTLDESRVVRLTAIETGNEYYPVWSPDGASIAFMRFTDKTCSILMVSALGGAERVLDSCYSGLVNPFSWTADGRGIVTTSPSKPGMTDMAIVSGPIGGGSSQWLAYQHELTDIDLDARYSPDGAWIAFRRGANPYSDLFLVPAGGGNVRKLTQLTSRIRGYDWTRDGTALIFSSNHSGQQALYTVGIADAHVEALGVQPAEYPSTARGSDAVVYEIPRVRTQLAEFSVDESQPPLEPAPSTGSDSAPAMSPVNDDMAFISDRSGRQQLWLRDAASGDVYALGGTSEPNLHYPVWRNDGRRLVVTAREGSIGRLIEIDIASRVRRVLTTADEDVRNGGYGLRPGTFIAVVNAKDHRSELIEFESTAGTEVSRRVLAHDVARADADQASDALYFTRITEPGLFRLDGRSGEETRMSEAINASHLDGWRVQQGRIFYFVPKATGPSEVHVSDARTGEDRKVANVPGTIGDLSFSVSHDGRRVVLSRVVSEDTDVGAFNLSRDGIG